MKTSNPVEPRQAKPRDDLSRLFHRAKVSGRDEHWQAFEAKFRPKIYKHALKELENHEDAADITQKTFLKMWQNRHKIHENDSIEPWGYKTASNTIIDHLRARKRRQAQRIDETLATRQLSPGEFEQQIRYEKIIHEANSLPKPYKTVFTLRHINGMRVKEIAELLKQPEGTIKTHAFRAKEELLKKLKQ